MIYTPPKDIWDVSNTNLKYQEPLDAKDPRYVETEAGRGNVSFNRIYRPLGVEKGQVMKRPSQESYTVFCGHRGCGKSTELKRLAKNWISPIFSSS